MQFLYPGILIGLLAIAIPILIHLFYFRRFKRVPFSNVRFLKEIKEETSTRSKLRNLLVLLMRIVAIAALVFAFAQPFIPSEKESTIGPKAVSIFFDNSYSMSALDKDVPLFEKARQKAKEVINAYSQEDLFQILTHDFEGRHQRLVSKEEALNLVDEIKTTPEVRLLSKVTTRQKQALATGLKEDKISYIISDFQQSITDLNPIQDTTVRLNLVPLQAVQESNIGIDSVWLDAPVPILLQPNRLFVKVKNYSNQNAEEVRLAMEYAGQVKPQGTLSIPAGSAIVDTINFVMDKSGWQEIIISITDYPVQFDDKYYLSFPVREQLNILTINDTKSNKYLDAAFEGISYFNNVKQNSKSLDYSSFNNYQLIVLNELNNISSGLSNELKEYIINGGNVLTIPRAESQISSTNQFLNSLGAGSLGEFEKAEKIVHRINTQEFVFKDVFDRVPKNIRLPRTTGGYSRKAITNAGEEILLTYRDGTPFLLKKSSGTGNLYVLTAPLDVTYNDLVKNGEIFIPMLFKMSFSTSQKLAIAQTIGRDEILEIKSHQVAPDEVLKLKGTSYEFLPEQRIFGEKIVLGINQQISTSGFYRLSKSEHDTLGVFAFNYDRRESVLDYYNTEALKDLYPNLTILGQAGISDLSGIVKNIDKGQPLWRWGLIIALLALLAEILLLRFWKI